MKCDFYIYSYLEIEHNKGISYYPLFTQLGYYDKLIHSDYRYLINEIFDSDYERDFDSNNNFNSMKYEDSLLSEAYEKLSEMHEKTCDIIKKITISPKKPIIIYDNNLFVTQKLETKYFPIIQKKLNNIYIHEFFLYEDTGIFTDMSEVIKITKKVINIIPSSDEWQKIYAFLNKNKALEEEKYKNII